MRGSVKQRGSSWRVMVDIGDDPSTGKRRQQSFTCKTKREAEKKLAKLITQVDSGGYVRPAKVTVADFLRQWLQDYASVNVRARTAHGYQHKIERHIIPTLGAVPLADLRPDHLTAFYAQAMKDGRADGKEGGLSARTVRHFHRILHDALAWGVRMGLVARNVADAVTAPRAKAKEMRALDNHELTRLLEKARETEWYAPIHLAAFTGMRRSEVLGLRWQDVDLDLATISVTQTLHDLGSNKIVIERPKSAKSARQIALSPSACLVLRSHRERQENERAMFGLTLRDTDLVFSRGDGSAMLPNSLTHAFGRIARAAGLPDVHLHTLRHSHASLMLQAGVNVKTISSRLGHANIGITMDVYAHLLPGADEGAALQFEQAMNGHALAPARISPE